jgi:hypothetical protein
MSVVSATGALTDSLSGALVLAFNPALVERCTALRIKAFPINWSRASEGPNNCFEGSWSFDELLEFEVPAFPAVCWWIGGGQDLNLQKPRTFSGRVEARWRLIAAVRGMSNRGLAAQRDAFETALLATLLSMGDAGYNKDLVWGDPVEQQWIDQSAAKHVGWVQEVNYTASFEVNV